MKHPRSVFGLRCVLGLLSCLPGLAAHAGEADADAARIRAERVAAQSQFDSQQRECATRFAVNACMDAARKQRRDALAALKRRQIALDEAERQRRAAQRQADLRARLEAQSSRRREGEAAPVVSMRKPRDARQAAGPAPSRPSLPASSGSREQADREQRRLNQQHKLQAAQAHREAVEKRNAERATDRATKRKPAAAPLPVPGAASIPR